MRRPRRWAWQVGAATAGVSVLACGLRTPAGPEGELRDRRAAWEALAIHDYEITVQPSCYCLPDWIPRAVVVVRADTISELRRADTGEPVEHRYHYRTVNGLYDLLQDALDGGAASVEVTYDPSHHFPTTIAVDYDVNVADEEIAYTVSGLIPHE